MGAGLLAKAACQSLSVSLIHRFREQARSHILLCVHLGAANYSMKVTTPPASDFTRASDSTR